METSGHDQLWVIDPWVMSGDYSGHDQPWVTDPWVMSGDYKVGMISCGL